VDIRITAFCDVLDPDGDNGDSVSEKSTTSTFRVEEEK